MGTAVQGGTWFMGTVQGGTWFMRNVEQGVTWFMRTPVRGGTWFKGTPVIGDLQIFTTEHSINHKTHPKQEQKKLALSLDKQIHVHIYQA